MPMSEHENEEVRRNEQCLEEESGGDERRWETKTKN